MKRCLYCYRELDNQMMDYHSQCSKKIYGSKEPPILPYNKKDLVKLAKKVVRSQTTLTGVQPKLSLNIEKAEGVSKRFTIVGLWGCYILKPQSRYYKQLPELEDLTMHLAEIAKIRVVPHSLIRFEDGELCYITKRIDRNARGQKYAMEDMCQLTEKLTEYKYKGSYEQIAKCILKYSATPKLDVINFWEEVLFAWITGNSDMHLKNFSLYSIKPYNYVLTPAYDLLPTKLVLPLDSEELALTLNGKKRKIGKSDFVMAMKLTGLENKIIGNIFKKFEKVLSKWLEFIDISFLEEKTKEEFKELIKNNFELMKE
ncbi:HipA domain-containing protein [Sanguibacteroides justesenii]|uniref:Toxin HipA n=1 Tax=Sanguibacteroides justesenii TaxID=1547597 RepID=A0AB34R2N8_9PORP|nr:HipA domain-containing protein [Sanguibacteroides justesenii]KIO43533.1 toxin HipA [Sanguibacteroides justesenii]PXZ45210.1 type II toxin-antitoxin system HipA family toxin [Sanguibacteroides justesenii]